MPDHIDDLRECQYDDVIILERSLKIQHFFDEATSTLTYLVHDEATRLGVVIDPVADFDPASGRTGTRGVEELAAYALAYRLKIPFVLDTHVHADHLSGIPYFTRRFGARSVIGANIAEVQRTFRDLFNLAVDFPVDGSQFNRLLNDGDSLRLGRLRIEALHTPGHTPACVTYRIGDALFVGDTLFMPDYGTARCDFPGGSAAALYDSIQKLYALPDETRVFMCHDYQPGGREVRFQSTIGEERAENVHLNARTSREEFVVLRKKRDAELPVPRLLLPSIEVNIRAGELPGPESNGLSYLKLPLNAI